MTFDSSKHRRDRIGRFAREASLTQGKPGGDSATPDAARLTQEKPKIRQAAGTLSSLPSGTGVQHEAVVETQFRGTTTKTTHFSSLGQDKQDFLAGVKRGGGRVVSVKTHDPNRPRTAAEAGKIGPVAPPPPSLGGGMRPTTPGMRIQSTRTTGSVAPKGGTVEKPKLVRNPELERRSDVLQAHDVIVEGQVVGNIYQKTATRRGNRGEAVVVRLWHAKQTGGTTSPGLSSKADAVNEIKRVLQHNQQPGAISGSALASIRNTRRRWG